MNTLKDNTPAMEKIKEFLSKNNISPFEAFGLSVIGLYFGTVFIICLIKLIP